LESRCRPNLFAIPGHIIIGTGVNIGREGDRVGKNRNKGVNSDPAKEKTQELEETKRLPKGFFKNNPQKSK
jgi:hypothetical protein